MSGILASVDSNDISVKYIRSKANPANSFMSPETGLAFRRNTDFACGKRTPTLPDYTTLEGTALKEFLANGAIRA